MSPSLPAVSVVLPLLGDPTALLSAVDALVAAWPQDVDAELLVPARPLEPRAARLLAGLEGDVAVVPASEHATVGELVAAAAGAASGGHVLVLDATALTTSSDLAGALAAVLGGGPALPGAALLVPDALPPALDAALDLRSVAALAGGPVVAPLPPLAAAPLAGPGTPGLVSLVAPPGPATRAAAEAGRATRLRTEVVPDASRAAGDVLVRVEPGAALPRFWAEGLLAALEAHPAAVAAGPWWSGAPLPRGTSASSTADAWRRDRTGRTGPTGALAPGCAAVRRTAAHLPLGPQDLVTAEQVLARPAERGPLLSAALIVKDEQAALPACLASLRGLVDEVVVCDTGSTDRTVEVAVALGARVVHAPWTGDFAAARNAALAACTGTWVLSIDADEQLELAPGTDLRGLLRAHRGEALSVRIHSAGEDGAGYAHEAGRLFRRTGLTWVGAVHENLQRADGSTPVWAAGTGVSLAHDGYLDAVYAAKDKAARNLALAEKDHEQAEGTPRAWKSAYELARALSKQPDEVEERIGALLEQALATMPSGVAHLRTDALVRLAESHERRGDVAAAHARAREAVASSPADPAAALLCARLALEAEGPAEALAVLDARPAPDARSMALDVAKEQIALPLLRGRLLLLLDRPAEAAAPLLAVAAAHPAAADWQHLARALPDDLPRLAAAVAAAPEPALAALDPLPADLEQALRAAGVDVDAARPEAVRARLLQTAVAGSAPEAVAAAARALEDEDPASALGLWRTLPGASAVVGAVRCLLALDRAPEAVAALEGLDASGLGPDELLVVALLLRATGADALAAPLFARVPPEMRRIAGLPERVEHALV